MKPLIIYHGNCADGFTAAWLANIWFFNGAEPKPHGLCLRPDEWVVDHHGAKYDETPPDVKGRHVFILDFSYRREVMLQMGAEAASITHIDHHKTSIDLLGGLEEEFAAKGLCPLTVVFNTERSGAYLTSLFFWAHDAPDDMVKLVDDRDRWVFADARSRPFHASLFSRPYKIGEWNRLSANVDQAVAEGPAIERKHHKDIAELLDACTMQVTIAGQQVPCANLSYMMASDGGAELLRRFPDAPFAATWFMNEKGQKVVSLRSRNGSDVDVALIAQQYDGGGHKHASGFRASAGEIIQ